MMNEKCGGGDDNGVLRDRFLCLKSFTYLYISVPVEAEYFCYQRCLCSIF